MRISDWSSDVCSSDLAMNAATNRRFESLDAIRGVAVMGILAMNIVAFALPFSAYSNPAAGGPPAPADLATWVFDFVFVDSKMRGLFSLLFEIGRAHV